MRGGKLRGVGAWTHNELTACHLLDIGVDVNRLLELEPQDQYALRRKHPLEEQCRERAEKMKEEAMAKLKELGNSLLGAFGFSLDNFQMQQDPNTGSYSISFQK